MVDQPLSLPASFITLGREHAPLRMAVVYQEGAGVVSLPTKESIEPGGRGLAGSVGPYSLDAPVYRVRALDATPLADPPED